MKTEEIALSRVSENEANPRTITEANFQKLVKSILVFPKMLQLRPIVLDETYKALGGNMRTRALCHIVSMTPEAIMDVLDTDQRLTDAEKLAIANYWSQWKEQPTATIVKASDLTESQKKEFIIKDNAGFGDWDTDALANHWNTNLLKDWGIQDWQLQGWMSPDSLKNGEQADEDQMVAKDDEFDEDTEKIPQRCKECELWQLGKHLLMCGDSTDAEQVKFLMGGQVANMVFTDPPYGLSIGDKNANLNSVQKPGRCTENIKNDTLPPDRLYPLLVKAMTNCREICADDATYFVTSPQGGELGMMMMMMMKDAGLPVRHILIWEKNSATFSLGVLDYDYQHEQIFYTWAKKHKNYRKGEFRTTIWKYDKPRKCGLHPTMKPVELVANCMKDGTVEGDSVLDVFGGSGTTLIAAEQLNRNAFLMEIDPHYCDVIIARWEKLTGEKAVKIDEFKKRGE